MRGRLFKIVLFCCAILLCSCSKKNNDRNNSNVENEEMLYTNDTEFSKSDYSLYKNRVSIPDCQKNYEADMEAVKAGKSDILSFDSCEFKSIENLQPVSVLHVVSPDITPEESVDAIKKWLKILNIDDMDTDKEIRDASGQYELDKDKEYPYDYPAVADHYLDFESGGGFFLNTNRCHIQMGGRGIYSMSDGTITKYLGEKTHAGRDFYYSQDAELVAEGRVSELADQSWELISGKMTVKDAAELTKHYFEQGLVFPCAKDVTIDVPEVWVYRLNDKFVYNFNLRRVYQGIPFTVGYYGNYHMYTESYEVNGETRNAYVANDQTVCAYAGSGMESDDIIPITEAQDYIIDLREAVSIIEKNIAIEVDIDVEEVEFVYCPCRFKEEENYAFPCWEFRGTNQLNKEKLHIYVDALSGDIYLYGYRVEEE